MATRRAIDVSSPAASQENPSAPTPVAHLEHRPWPNRARDAPRGRPCPGRAAQSREPAHEGTVAGLSFPGANPGAVARAHEGTRPKLSEGLRDSPGRFPAHGLGGNAPPEEPSPSAREPPPGDSAPAR